ncbi:MAG: RIP metalloprotease RseP [Gammaproteobacteria bacterium]|nr:RIP metalloprotease RseP [Gammaproteobacteria bacterium]
MELIYTIAVTLFTLAVLVTVHEYGHFWVARRCGVKVLRFSIGFGTPLYRWRDKLDTEYVIALIPLGGYVKMLDEREGEVTPGMAEQAFNRKPVLVRIAVVSAGPLANLVLAVLAYWFVFISGETGIVPLIGEVEQGSVAEIAGLEGGQEIVAIDGHATPTWQAVNFRLLERIGDSGPLEFSVRYPGSDVVYNSRGQLQNWLSDAEEPNLIRGLGIQMYRPGVPVVLNEVVESSPAAAAGLTSGDLIVSADGQAMPEWMDWVDYVRARPDQAIVLRYERAGVPAQTVITPARKLDDQGEAYGQVGVSVQVPEWPPEMVREFHYGPLEALFAATERTGDLVMFTLKAIKKMLTGLISPKNLSGPITIAKVASASAHSGLEAYVAFLALLSVSLGVLNLLPIPVLDGGHLLYYTIELLVGRPVPLKVQMVGYQVGLFIIVGVMMLALYNDFARL